MDSVRSMATSTVTQSQLHQQAQPSGANSAGLPNGLASKSTKANDLQHALSRMVKKLVHSRRMLLKGIELRSGFSFWQPLRWPR
jgi:predicted DNA-binding protein (UPF0251 family)